MDSAAEAIEGQDLHSDAGILPGEKGAVGDSRSPIPFHHNSHFVILMSHYPLGGAVVSASLRYGRGTPHIRLKS